MDDLLTKWCAKLDAYDDWLNDQGPYPDMQMEVDEIRVFVEALKKLLAPAV